MSAELKCTFYYGDGSEYTGSFAHAAPLNLQVVTLPSGGQVSGYDYYWEEDGRLYGGDMFGLFEYLQRSGLVKFGRTIPATQFDEIVRRAQEHSEEATGRIGWTRT